MKIYAITKGCYSDYHICALTTSKEKAERLKAIYSNNYRWSSGEAEIEEYEDGEGGDLRTLWTCDENGLNPNVCPVNVDDKEEIITYKNGEHKGKVYRVFVFANDADHATKKAQDMIAQYKAEKAGL